MIYSSETLFCSKLFITEGCAHIQTVTVLSKNHWFSGIGGAEGFCAEGFFCHNEIHH